MSKKQNDEEWPGWIALTYLMLKSSEHEWDKMRDLASDECDEEIIKEYFLKLFNDDYNEEIIPINRSFFRARQIKKDNIKDLEINKLTSKTLEPLIKECEKINNSKIGIIVDFIDFLFVKSIVNEDEREKNNRMIAKLMEQLDNTPFLGFAADKSGIPPLPRQEGRLNSINDPYIYLSNDVNTAITEMRPIIGQEYSVAECKTLKELRVVNLHSYDTTDQKRMFSQLYVLIDKVSEPNTEPNSTTNENNLKQKKHNFYKITQILAHFLEEKGYDGIIYKSSLFDRGINLVLFDAKNVKFIGSKIIKIKDVNVKYDYEMWCIILKEIKYEQQRKKYLSLKVASQSAPLFSKIKKRNEYISKTSKKLYKYRKFDEYTVDIIENDYVFREKPLFMFQATLSVKRKLMKLFKENGIVN